MILCAVLKPYIGIKSSSPSSIMIMENSNSSYPGSKFELPILEHPVQIKIIVNQKIDLDRIS